MRIVSIINQKGGCGKTTTAINLAGVAAKQGLRTLLVDLDPQSHCAAGLAIPEQRIDLDIGDAMLTEPDKAIDPTRLLWRASRNLDLIPSRMTLAGLEAARGGLADKPEPERRLRHVLHRFTRQYDLCLIDCPPGIGLLTYNGLAAASDVLIPVETGFFALHGAQRQVNTIRSLGKRLGHVPAYWLMATMHDAESPLANDLLEEMRRRFTRRLAPCMIRRDPKLREAASFGQPVIEYAPQATGAADYSAALKWLLSTSTTGGGTALLHDADAEPVVIRVPTASTVEVKPSTDHSHAAVIETKPIDLPWINPAPNDSAPGWSTNRNGGHAVATAPSLAPPAIAPMIRTTSDAGDALLSRAEEVATRARALLLRQADDHLARFAQQSTVASESAGSAVQASTPSVLRVEVTESTTSQDQPLIRSETIRRLLGVRQTRSGVLFVQPLSLGQRISIAGDFNNWSETACPMTRNTNLGVFEACLQFPPGMHRYRLVIDGRWSTDPFNEWTEPNPFGELNSVIQVQSAQSLAAAG